MAKFSLRTLMLLIGLVAFVLAASRDEDYAYSSLLRSTCVGILIYGLASQVLDLWKARFQWKSATRGERNGWRLAIFVRCLVIDGIMFSSFATVGTWLHSASRDDSEYNARVEAVSNALEPMMLICALAFAPWCWRRSTTSGRRVIHGSIAILALAALLMATWHQASMITAMIHIAISGVSAAQPLRLDPISPAQAPDLMQFTQNALASSWLALGLAIAAALALYARSWTTRLWMQIPLWALAALAAAASASQVLWLKQIAFPRISPLLAGSIAEMEPRLEGTIAGACLFVGALAAAWMEISRTPQNERPWRQSVWYPHETRFFYELLVFSIVVENIELLQQMMEFFGAFSSLFSGNVSGLYVLLIGTASAFFYEPLQLAILILSLSGLFQRRKVAPPLLAQTPGPASLLALILGTPIAALCAYLIAKSMLWSNFFYWITTT